MTDPIIQAMAEAIIRAGATRSDDEFGLGGDAGINRAVKERWPEVVQEAQAALAVARPLIEKPLRDEIARLNNAVNVAKQRMYAAANAKTVYQAQNYCQATLDEIEQALQEKAG